MGWLFELSTFLLTAGFEVWTLRRAPHTRNLRIIRYPLLLWHSSQGPLPESGHCLTSQDSPCHTYTSLVREAYHGGQGTLQRRIYLPGRAHTRYPTGGETQQAPPIQNGQRDAPLTKAPRHFRQLYRGHLFLVVVNTAVRKKKIAFARKK